MVEDYWSNYEKRLERKNAALQKAIQELRDQNGGVVRTSDYNYTVSSKDVAFELGSFSDTIREIDERLSTETLEGLIVRCRVDSLAARLNSAKILDLIEGDERDKSSLKDQLQSIKNVCFLTLGLAIGSVVGLLGTRVF